MSEAIRQFAVLSRAEFLLPNLGSLIMGLAWGASPPIAFTEMIILVVLSFTIINLSSAIGAQVNTISDYELDSRDNRKEELVQALDAFGINRLKCVLIAEFVVTLALVVVFILTKANPLLLILWIVVTLILVLAVFPIIFAYFTFTTNISFLFLLALAGLASTIYGVIVPTETRDYFGDKTMGIETMTVRLGLAKASLLSIILLSLGGLLIGVAFITILIN
jgi:4-hydroxybenzoate polyprenyltransferase